MKPEKNLRGWTVAVDFDGKDCIVTVLTHIRDDRWMVYGRTLPKRFERWLGCRRTIVSRNRMTLMFEPSPSHGKS